LRLLALPAVIHLKSSVLAELPNRYAEAGGAKLAQCYEHSPCGASDTLEFDFLGPSPDRAFWCAAKSDQSMARLLADALTPGVFFENIYTLAIYPHNLNPLIAKNVPIRFTVESQKMAILSGLGCAGVGYSICHSAKPLYTFPVI